VLWPAPASGAACSNLHDTVTHGRRRVTNRYTEVAIIGDGAAGIATGRRLADACVDCLIVEARRRLGRFSGAAMRRASIVSSALWRPPERESLN